MFTTWLATSPLASFAKVFIAVLIGAAVADWASAGAIDFAHWQTWIIGALVAAIPLIVNWLNPADARYGRGKAADDA